MNKIFLFLIVILCSAGSVNAQWQGQSPTIPSPNAASLGLYTELPVSYFTGIPNISVPLYTIKGNKISLPIEMSYNASGLRPEVHPDWVGNGWSLSAGGVITRKANGTIDEYNKASTGEVGYYFTHGYLNASNWATNAATNQYVLYPYIPSLGSSQPGDADEQPDEFDFNFADYSGKFFLDQNGQWQVQCDKNLTVSFQSSDLIEPFVYYQSGIGGSPELCKTFGRFTITDENGNQYIFGSVDTYNTAIEFNDVMIPNNVNTSAFTATSWYLSEIISADKTETINLSYERGPLQSYINFGFDANMGGHYPKGFGVSGFSCSSNDPGSGGFNGNIIFPVYLTKITMPSQDLEVDFSKSASNELSYPSASVNSYTFGNASNAYIRVFEDAGVPLTPVVPYDFPSIYLYDFTSSDMIPYFAPPHQAPPEGENIGYATRCIWLKCDGITIQNTSLGKTEKTINFSYNNDPTRRLQLNSLSINDGNSQVVQHYGFTYNPTPLPTYLGSNTDSWGFNNNNRTVIQTGPNNNFGAVRAVDQTGVQTQAEILTGISYPTGGTTNFYYEPNIYSSYIDRSVGVSPTVGSGIAGGLRVNRIVSTDNNGNSLTRKYYYVNNYTPSVNPASLISSGVLDSKPSYNIAIAGLDLNNMSFNYQSVSSNPIVPLTTSSTGTHIGYTNVVEVLSDGSYSIYNFTNSDDTRYQDIAVPASNKLNPNALDFYYSTSRAYERGKLQNKTDYNNAGYPVSSEATTYSNSVTTYGSPAPTFAANVVASANTGICSGNSVGFVSRTAFQLLYAPFVPISQINTTYDLNLTGANNKLTTTTNTTYDQYKNIIEQDITNSDGNVQKVRYLYPYNFSTSATTNPYSMMVAQNMDNVIIEKIKTVITNGTEYVTGGEVHTYQLYSKTGGGNQLVNDAVYNFESISSVIYSTKAVSTYLGSATPGQLSIDGNYKLRNSLYYDANKNLSSTIDDGGRVDAYLWDYNGSEPVAKVINASNIYSSLYSATIKNDIAYNSFEYNNATDMTNGTGNWSGISISNIIHGGAVGGNSYYNLTTSVGALVSGTLSPSQKYIVSYWSKNGAYTVSGSTSLSQGTSLPSLTNPVWTYYQHTVSNVSSVSITGNGAIDELRLYPLGSQMTSYTWEPLVGLKGVSDVKSEFTYYAYDAFERLSTLSDQTGSIMKSYAYNYASAANQPQITAVTSSGGNIIVQYVPINGCYSGQLNYTDITASGTTSHDNGGCSSPFVISGLAENGHTYQVTITCYSSAYPSGTTSAPATVVVN